ncbi:MAG: DUF2182 domain-containing protein [Rhodospirillales bacterium]|nr:DUF2182 domain-containing protein [Rhodospirillales bacterium]
MTSTRTSATAAALTATVGLAAASWGVLILGVGGMGMGVATPLGSFASFMVMWVPMMAAMMLPGMAPTVLRHTDGGGHASAVLLFVGSYLAVWAFVGIPVYTLYQPHGTLMAGAVTLAAGLYELTPLKHVLRRRCCRSMRSGLTCGLYCVGSCIGLMAMQVALGVMSLTWMAMTALVVLAQKLLPTKAAIDVPVALAIIGLGILIVVAPSSVPGLMPSM